MPQGTTVVTTPPTKTSAVMLNGTRGRAAPVRHDGLAGRADLCGTRESGDTAGCRGRPGSLPGVGDKVAESSSGNLNDLSACVVGEYVTYPGIGNFNWPSPPYLGGASADNPTINNVSATTGGRE